MHSILIKDYMVYDAHAVSIDSNVYDVVKVLINTNSNGVPVVDDNKTVVGFVSEQDCMKEMLNDSFFCQEPVKVSSVMHKDVMSVSPSTSIIEIAQTMLESKPKSYPVIDNGKLVGIINRGHILKALIETDEDCYHTH